MDRAAIFVDAGYVFAEGGKLCCGVTSRSQLLLDVAAFNALLCDRASGCGLPVLRTYWYDAAKEGVPSEAQQSIASLPNVKLRLGRLNSQNQQKGVDALIYRDLMTLARERAIAEAFLVSGDEDLREGVRAAQDQGVRVTVVGIEPARSGSYNQSRDLLNEADVVMRLGRNDLSGLFTLLPHAAPQGSPSGDGVAVEEPAAAFAQEWVSRASGSELTALLAQKPRIPPPLDAELLRHVQDRCGRDLRSDEDSRWKVRRAFWAAVEATGRAAGEP